MVTSLAICKCCQTALNGGDAVELAAAMAAAAEAAVSNNRDLQEARKFAEVVWARYSANLFTTSDSPHEQFVHLIHELGMDKLALKIADRLKVCLSILNNVVITTARMTLERSQCLPQGKKLLHACHFCCAACIVELSKCIVACTEIS